MDQLVRGVGTVCVADAGLEWSLAYLTHAMRGWDDAKLNKALGQPGRIWHEFKHLAGELAPLLGSDVQELRDKVGALREERDRLVHAVWMATSNADGSAIFEAWHPRADITRTVTGAELFDLASRITATAADVQGLTVALLDRASRGELS